MGVCGITKYPRTYHLWGSKTAGDDKMLSEDESVKVLSDSSATYVWESKLDGTNLGLRFKDFSIVIQNRGHVLGSGEHPQYHMLWPWTSIVSGLIYEVLKDHLIMYGEYCYAVHTVRYSSLPHYFNEFDVYDTRSGAFLDTPNRTSLLAPLVEAKVLAQVPVVYEGMLSLEDARELACSYPPQYGEDRPEGLYLKIEKGGVVIGRYKIVRDEFTQKIIDDNCHWRTKSVEVQGLAKGVDIFAVDLQ